MPPLLHLNFLAVFFSTMMSSTPRTLENIEVNSKQRPTTKRHPKTSMRKHAKPFLKKAPKTFYEKGTQRPSRKMFLLRLISPNSRTLVANGIQSSAK
ncbi:hypothetical protein LguiA_009009 [Lonicera macranthoides]